MLSVLGVHLGLLGIRLLLSGGLGGGLLSLGGGLGMVLGLGGLEVDLGATATMVRRKRGLAARALVVHILEGGNHVRDTSKADNTASKQSHHMGETTGLIADGGHDTLVAVGALNGGGLGSKADEGHAIGIGGDAILSAEASGLGLGRAV